MYGKGRVTPDGRQVAPDAGVQFRRFTGAMINDGENPPGKGPRDGDKKKDGDPVDLATGIFVSEKTDLVLPDVLPLALTRTYRSQDTESRSFGIATTHLLDMFLWSAQQYQEADLILPDGGRVHYVRVSPGTGFADAVFESTTSPSGYFKSRITWNGAGYTLRLKDGTTYVFGENAPLQSIRDRFGNTITLTREGTNAYGNQIGEITQVTSSNGRWIRFTYDAADRITRAEDNIGRAVTYEYDASGRLWKVTDAGGGVTEYGYSTVAGATHRMLTIKDPRGLTYLTNEYDANGRVTKQTQSDATIYRFAYTLDGGGNVTQTEVTDPRNNVRRVTFNSAGYPTADTLAVGKPEQQQTTYEREAGTNLLLSETDALARKTAYSYDTSGNVTTVTELAGTPQAVTSTFTYDSGFNDIASVTDPLNHTTTYTYDTAGRLEESVNALGKHTTYTYNAAGQPLTIRDPLTNETLYRYERGDPVETTDPLGRKSTRFIDAAGRIVAVTDALGARSRSDYDALNRVTKATNARGDATTFAYDANGNLTSLTDARGKVTTWTYDSMDRVTSRKDALLKTESFVYDGMGNVTRFTDRRAKITNYTYDALGRRLTTVFASPAGTVTYTYDAGDRVTKAVDTVAGTIDRTFDKLDRLTGETSPRGTVAYVHDAAGRRTSMTVGGQTAVMYGYDAVGQPTSITRGATAASAAYDDAGRPTSLTLPNGIVQAYAYDQASQLTGITYTQGAATLGELGYGYDLSSRRVAASGSFARTGIPAAVATTTYDNGNHLTKWGTPTLTYDANGNVSKDASGATYTWNNRNQLASISGGGITASFSYDALGRRTKSTVNGATTQFLSDGSNLVQEQSSTGSPTANLLTGLGVDSLFARTEGTTTRSLLTDGLGSTLATASAAGAIETSYTYEPFGKTTVSGTASTNKTQFTGRENDGATGLYSYRARYYNPSYGRFVSEDPIGFAGGDPNLYAYVGNSPLNLVDPYGLCGSIPGLDLLNAVQGRCGLAGGIFIAASYTPWGRALRIARAVSRAAQGARGVSRASTGRGVAAGRPCNCFPAGTRVKTAHGSKPIERIEVGDRVWARDLDTGKSRLRRVTGLFSKQAQRLLTISVGGTHLEVSPQHPVWVNGNGWTDAGDLREGDQLARYNGRPAAIESISERALPVTVFNFEVEGDHNYYVSDAQLLVHNCRIDWSQAPRSQSPIQSSPNSVRTGISPGGHLWEAHYDQFGRRVGRTDWDGSVGKSNPHHHTFDPITQQETGAHLPGEFVP